MLHARYDPILVVLSVILAAMASYTALDLVGRVAALRGRARELWLGAGALALGIGIWSMHFVGMLAFQLPVPVGYDVPLVLLSALVAVVASLFGLVIAGRRERVGNGVLLLAALPTGLAVAGMHYVGMAALRGAVRIQWRAGLVALSVAIAIVAGFGVLRLAFGLRDERAQRGHTRRRFAAALALAGTIAAMHYVGMSAARFVPAPAPDGLASAALVATDGMAALLVIGTVVMLGIALLGAGIDRRLRTASVEAEALRRSEARLRVAYDALGFGVLTIDAEGRVQHANPAAAGMLGVPVEAVRGRAAGELPVQVLDERGQPIPPDDAPARRVARTQQPVLGEVIGLRSPQGRTRWVLVEAVPVVDADTGRGQTILSLVDITDRQAAESRLRRTARDLEAAITDLQRVNADLLDATQDAEEARAFAEEANRAKSDFLATMSHELRTPLNAVLGYADLLEMEIGGPLTDAQRNYLRRARTAGTHLLGLINDVLDLAKIEAGSVVVQQRPLPIAEPLAAALAITRPQTAARGIALEAAGGAEATRALIGDEARVRQVLVNLVSNAIKFTPSGGRITVEVTGAETRAPGVAEGSWRGAWTVVRVRDSGIGIPADKREAVFEPFVQLDGGLTRSHGGTGLGLAISRRLARQMGGDLVLEWSAPDEGSAFALWLPAPGDAAPTPAAPLPVDARLAIEPPAVGALLATGSAAEIVRAMADRLRADPAVPTARRVAEHELEDHLATLVSDVAQCLQVPPAPDAEATAFQRDGAEIQRLVGWRHGEQRARLGWSEAELRREFEVLRQEAERVVRAGAGHVTDASLASALALVARQLRFAESVSLDGWRASATRGHDHPSSVPS